jgi:hypothetical protein
MRMNSADASMSRRVVQDRINLCIHSVDIWLLYCLLNLINPHVWIVLYHLNLSLCALCNMICEMNIPVIEMIQIKFENVLC